MPHPIRTGLIALALLVATPSGALTPASAAAQQRASLELRRTKYFVDENGVVWLSVHLGNAGHGPIDVAGLAPSRWGPWSSVGQKVEPGAVVRGAMKVGQNSPSVVWVDSSQGLIRFELPKRQ